MGLFEKKYCDICGEKIGLLGNRKLEDGNICSKCAGKLSPFFTGRKKSTLNDIKEQLAYREQNKERLSSFNPTVTYGHGTKVYVDQPNGCFVVSRRSNYRDENPDIINFSQVSSANYNIEEHRNQLYTKDSDGRSVPYNPPRYEYSYEIEITINVNSPYFSEIKFELTDDRPESRGSMEFQRYEQEANELINAVRGMNMGYQQGYPQQNQFMNQGYPQQNQFMNQGYPQQNQFPNQGYPQQNQFMNQGYPQQNQFPNQGYPQQNQFPNQGYPQQNQFPNQGYPQQNQFPQQPAQAAGWVCPYCGMQNSGNFCIGCGNQKNQ